MGSIGDEIERTGRICQRMIFAIKENDMKMIFHNEILIDA